MNISFVIPAYNEEKNIKNVIASIHEHVPNTYQYETIVVDHGSNDDTVEIARSQGAKVLIHPEGTIACLRNYGVSHSTGKVLVFLDADILLTPDWTQNIKRVVHALTDGERILTGSWYSIPDNPTWIEKYWFKPLERGDNTHINSGHLIISRQVFDEIGGFDEKLETGEDYEISMRAKAAGVELVDDTSLRVIHEGYPKGLLEFAKREFWHGKGDAASLALLLQSKVAMVALVFVVLHFFLIAFVALQAGTEMLTVLLLICGIAMGISILKYRGTSLITILVNSFIYYVYFWARGLSVLSLPGIRTMHKRTR